MRWQYHYLRELTLLFSFILITTYLLYALIDYASHGSLLWQEGPTLITLLLYYLSQFSLHAEIMVPLALLLANLRVLLTANAQREILLLTAAGISLKKISHPFLLFSLFVITLCYLNFEYIQPRVYLRITQRKACSLLDKKVHTLPLPDHSLLIYQSYDPLKQELFDLYWRKDEQTLYKMERLSWNEESVEGIHVDHLVKEPESNQFHRIAHHERLTLPLLFVPQDLTASCIPPKWQSISQLAQHMRLFCINEQQASITTNFLYKLLMPWIGWIVVLGPLSFCMQFRRRLFPFLIYTLALFVYITLFTILGASVILGENQILHPALAIGIPMGSLLLYLGYKYARL